MKRITAQYCVAKMKMIERKYLWGIEHLIIFIFICAIKFWLAKTQYNRSSTFRTFVTIFVVGHNCAITEALCYAFADFD